MNDTVRALGYLALGTRFKRIGERLQAQTQRVLDAHGLDIPAAHFPFLAAIDREGPLSVGELAEAVGVSQPGATRTLGQLAEAGLIEVTQASDDQRRKSAALTRQGERLVEAGKRTVWPLIERAVRELCSELSGPLLEQLAGIEDGMAAHPLHDRAARLHARRR